MTAIFSKEAYRTACQHIAAGVNSPVRAFKAVNDTPRFIQKAQGASICDLDGNTYIDYVGSWGPMIAGHAQPLVIEKIKKALENGLSFGAPTTLETELAKKIKSCLASIELLRFVNSGTEATMSALRLARAYTKRPKIIKFSGCYHGHHDSLLAAAGSGLLTHSIASSAGVPDAFLSHTLIAPYNDLQAVAALFEAHPETIAGIIVEPIAANMGCVLPQPDFLSGLRQLCDKFGSLLIFDEVITGFRVARGGAQGLYNVFPDLTCLGKIIGGGLPLAAFGGKEKIMAHLAPNGDVYQAGTLSGNPIAVTAGLATLEIIDNEAVYQNLAENTKLLVEGLRKTAKSVGVDVLIPMTTGLFSLFFTSATSLPNYEAIEKNISKTQFHAFFHGMLENGIYLAPSPFECAFLSIAHTTEDIEKTIAASQAIFEKLRTLSKD